MAISDAEGVGCDGLGDFCWPECVSQSGSLDMDFMDSNDKLR